MEYIVEIYVAENGYLAYRDQSNNPAWTLHLDPDDTVSWKSNAGDFCLLFPRSPFETVSITAQVGSRTQTLQPRSGMPFGSYKYFVALFNRVDKKPPLCADPEVDIGH